VGRGRLGDEEAPLRRRAEGGVPVGLRQLLDRLGHESFAGCVHEQVEPAELLDRALDELPRLLGVGEIAVRAARGLHRPAFALEPRCDRGSDAPGSPCDKPFHGTPQDMSCIRVIFGL